MKDPSTSCPDYYSILQVKPDASAREIRISFKRLVLASHPDKNPGRRDWSERRIRELIEAFDVLGNEQSRASFDVRRQDSLADAWKVRRPSSAASERQAEPFFFRKQDPESKALLILYYLLNRKARPAVRVLREMEDRIGREFLRTYLERDDYLDCLFLLAEFYCGKRDYLKASEHLRAFYAHEKLSRFPRHYLSEVIRLLKDIYLRKIPRAGNAEASLRALRDAADLRLTRAEEGLRLRKMAELCLETGNLVDARRALDSVERLFPLSKDTQKIRKRLDAAG